MKYLPVGLVFILLIFCGGLASRVLFPVTVEKDLAKQSSRILASAGVDAENPQFDHYFVSLAGQAPASSNAKPVVVKHVGGQVWAASYAPGKPNFAQTGPQSKFTADVKENGVIALSGEVHSNRFKNLIENSALDAIGTRSVENQITVNEELEAPHWKDIGPNFLKHFLSFSGVSHFSASRTGINLDGEVLSREVREKLGEQAAKLVTAPAVLKNNLSVKAPKYPTFKLQGSSAGLKLSGLLPDEATRRNLIAAVQKALPESQLKDEIEIAGGVAKPWWLPNAENLIPMFLKETKGVGSIEYWKNRLHVSGMVDNESFAKKLSAVPLGPEKPEDFSMHSDLSLRPTKDPEVSVFTNKLGKLVAKGTIGNRKFKDQVLTALLHQNPDNVVLDQITVRDDIIDTGWGNPLELINAVVFNTEGGMIEFAAGKVEITGKVDTDEQKNLLGEFASSVAAEVENSITVKEVPTEDTATLLPEPEVDFKKVAVYFDSGSSRVSSRYYDEVETTASLIKTLNPGTKLIVGGFADNRGNQDANRRLGEKRAASVRDRLVSLGIDKSRMTIKTFGEDVSNVSRRDLWKSRRVELSIDRE